ncbi:NAD(P)/FAD-dependent oxidoreductase [Streptomyces sp. 3211]|uniref:NAD(P)/FAD-dependent oxidoreductase n=1 Tax=Streptomyces sp. 3211 TaxID=1964449 RepID=UPI0009A48D5C|nr:FAD-dependent monooxygenase [Streptomyces sp. 3211]
MYDVIVVGARAAGAATAMLLAQTGARVLMLDRASFPSDTVSTHFIQPSGVERLANWKLLPELLKTGCPPINTITFHLEAIAINGTPYPVGKWNMAIAPRRVILDSLLVQAAANAGVEFRPMSSVRSIREEEGRVAGVEFSNRGRDYNERGQLIIGADGKHSSIARIVSSESYNDFGRIGCWFYGYWTGIPGEGSQAFVSGGRFIAAFPTNYDQHCVVAGWPQDDFAKVKLDPMAFLMSAAADLAPNLYDAIKGGAREVRLSGAGDLDNRYRRSTGPGWALVGDAGLVCDPVGAHGISSAFSQAEILARNVAASLGGSLEAIDDATAAYVQERDKITWDAFRTNAAFATNAPPPELLKALAPAQHDPRAATDFFGVHAGLVPISRFI